mgnify:CR=1 FL=1
MKTLRRKTVPVNRVLWGVISIRYRRLKDLALDTNISKESISRYIKGYIPIDRIQNKIAKFLDIPSYILFNEKDIKKRLELKENGNLKRLSDVIKLDNYNKFSKPVKYKIKRPVLYALLLSEKNSFEGSS